MDAFTDAQLAEAEHILHGAGIVSPGIRTYPKAEPGDKRLHAAMVQLARLGRARLVKQSRHWCLWAPAEQGGQ